MSDYTPTTANVRDCYTYAMHTPAVSRHQVQFDRWLNEVRAEAIRNVARLTKHQEHPFVSVGDILDYAQRVRNGEA